MAILFILVVAFSCHKPEDSVVSSPKPLISEILARPESTSITINLMSDTDAEVYCEYGTTHGAYPYKSETYNIVKGVPAEIPLTNLSPGQEYYYRTRCRVDGKASFFEGTEHSFNTARSEGSTFRFAVEADPHLDPNSDTAAYSLTLRNIAGADPDFFIDLGDTFMSEKLPKPISEEAVTARYLLFRSYFEKACHSVPLLLALGNHDGEVGWADADLAVTVLSQRRKYFSNPVPDQFYSGNSIPESAGLRQNYYSFEWGDALFVVLDPFWYSIFKGGWNYTLGKTQYDWFAGVLSASNAKFKFVFCHNLVGGNGNDARGGAEFAGLYEMGGYNLDGTWGFDVRRNGWAKPLHQLMKENNVTVFFHGHDHFYGKQEKDGVIYQVVPQPSNRNIDNLSASAYGYTEGVLLPGRGYILVTVSQGEMKTEYIATYLPSEETPDRKNASSKHTYVINR